MLISLNNKKTIVKKNSTNKYNNYKNNYNKQQTILFNSQNKKKIL